jgi:hypothetical protein
VPLPCIGEQAKKKTGTKGRGVCSVQGNSRLYVPHFGAVVCKAMHYLPTEESAGAVS